MADSRRKALRSLLDLSHELGREDRRMAILGEGNASAALDDGAFLVKASGFSLATLQRDGIVECRSNVLLSLLDTVRVSDDEVERALLASRVHTEARKPSVEALLHAYCLTLEGVRFVGHTHASAVNQVLCSPRAKEFAEKRIFPDEIVCCGEASVFIPYTDPGFQLAREVRAQTRRFVKKFETVPRMILIANHGIITLGRTPEAVLASMLMAEKSAAIWLGASALGGPTFLSKQDVTRIANRSDEHYRQRALHL